MVAGPFFAGIAGLVGCGADTTHVIRFAALSGGEPVACGADLSGVGTSPGPVTLRDFRLYVSELVLIGPGGEEAPLTLEEGPWQHERVGLLDFEDGRGACASSGTPETNTELTGTAELEEPVAIRFTLGVPFELNHLDTARAPAPLDRAAMFWNWRGGYKFLRLDLLDSGDGGPTPYNLHLGATGCASPAPVVAPDGPCQRPNRPSLELPIDPAQGRVVLDVAGLFAGIDTRFNTPDTPPGCMSGPDDPECVPVFRNLGLSVETGRCEDGCAGQRFFVAQ